MMPMHSYWWYSGGARYLFRWLNTDAFDECFQRSRSRCHANVAMCGMEFSLGQQKSINFEDTPDSIHEHERHCLSRDDTHETRTSHTNDARRPALSSSSSSSSVTTVVGYDGYDDDENADDDEEDAHRSNTHSSIENEHRARHERRVVVNLNISASLDWMEKCLNFHARASRRRRRRR